MARDSPLVLPARSAPARCRPRRRFIGYAFAGTDEPDRQRRSSAVSRPVTGVDVTPVGYLHWAVVRETGQDRTFVLVDQRERQPAPSSPSSRHVASNRAPRPPRPPLPPTSVSAILHLSDSASASPRSGRAATSGSWPASSPWPTGLLRWHPLSARRPLRSPAARRDYLHRVATLFRQRRIRPRPRPSPPSATSTRPRVAPGARDRSHRPSARRGRLT